MSIGNLAQHSQLDRLTQAIGEDDFGEALLNTARAVADVEHVLVFAFPPRSTPRAVISAGALDPDVACTLARDYCTELYLLDPHYPLVRAQPEVGPASWFAFDGGQGCCDAFLKSFVEVGRISDCLSLAANQDKRVHLVMFLKLDGGVFGSAQRWLLQQVGEVIAAHVRKHFSYMHTLKDPNQFMIGRILSEAPAFRGVTGRERAVCVGILTGHTSEAIALNLSISVNSVLTYRKRLYEKLNISSQNELFAQVIQAMMQMGQRHLSADEGEQMLSPFLNCMAETGLAPRPRTPADLDAFLSV